MQMNANFIAHQMQNIHKHVALTRVGRVLTGKEVL